MVRAQHGVLATRHARRGVDAVPVCFAVSDGTVAVPIDRIKPKVSTDLQRVKNLVADRRAALLCDHWDAVDWTRLWWVRASLTRIDATDGQTSTLESLLRHKYPPYQETDFVDLLVFRVEALSGWSARSPDGLPG